MAHSLDALRDFAPFMNQARLVVQSMQGSPDAAATYQRIAVLVGRRLKGWFAQELAREDNKKREWVVDNFWNLSSEGIGACRQWLEFIHRGNIPQELLEPLRVVEELRGVLVGGQPPDEAANARDVLVQSLIVPINYQEFDAATLDAVATEYEEGRRNWGSFAASALEVQKLFENMYPRGFRPDVIAIDPDEQAMIGQSLPEFAKTLEAKLPEDHCPIQSWMRSFPGGKRVSHLRLIWQDSRWSLITKVRQTAWLFMRCLRGTWALWKWKAAVRHLDLESRQATLMRLFARGYELEWYKDTTSPGEFVTWLSELHQYCKGEEKQFPKLEAALSGVLFPKEGEHFHVENFRPFLQARELHPGIGKLFAIREQVKEDISFVNLELAMCNIYFEGTRESFRGNVVFERFEQSARNLVDTCVGFENVNFR